MERKQWLDNTITQPMDEPTAATRKAMYKDILAYVHDEGVYIPISYSRTKAVHSKALQGVGFGVSQYEVPFEKMYMENTSAR